MTKERKRRRDAVGYKFKLFGCAAYLIKLDGKYYMYEAVIMREAKKAAGRSQALFSLYRDIHKAQSSTIIYGMRAICFDDFNNECHLCELEIHAEGFDTSNYVEGI